MKLNNIVNTLKEAYDNALKLAVTYTNSYGDTNNYEIWAIKPDTEYGNGEICERGYIKAFCGCKDNTAFNRFYTFKISRFDSTTKISNQIF